MKRRYFGTDGVRGKVGSAPITPDFVMKLGQAAGRVLKRHNPTGRASVLIGKDTRVSGYMLEAALDRKSTRLNSSHPSSSRMPSSA